MEKMETSDAGIEGVQLNDGSTATSRATDHCLSPRQLPNTTPAILIARAQGDQDIGARGT